MDLHFLDKITLENFLLCTPYEKRENRDLKTIDPNYLTEERFYNNLYTQPQTNETKINIDNIRRELSEMDFDEVEINTILRNRDSIESFKTSLESDNAEPLFVRGYSGTGKTTFIRTILYKLNLEKPNCHSIVFNMQDSLHHVYLFNGKWENEKFDKTVYIMVSLLMKYIGLLINKKRHETDIEYKNRLHIIHSKYTNLFVENVDPDIDKIFDVLLEFIEGQCDYYKGSKDSFCNRMYKTIVSFVPTSFVSDDNNIISSSINKLLKLICIWLLCKSENDNDKYFILLDNIEHYVNNEVIYDEDITLIVQIVRNFIADMNGYLEQSDIIYSSRFKVIFAIRDTTHKWIQYTEEQNIDFLTTHIDVSPFFSMDDVINKRCEFFKDSDIIKHNNRVIQMINSITSDIGLNHQISSMYNHNKRRMMICLIKAISIVERNYVN